VSPLPSGYATRRRAGWCWLCGQNSIVRAAAPVSSAVRAVPQTRIIGTCPVPAAGASDITSLYTARFGVPTAGDRVFVECNTMAEGWEGPRMVFTALVPTST
jgi:hypothetical protein